MAKKRSRPTRKSRKLLFLVIGLVLVIAVAASVYVHAHNKTAAPDETPNHGSTTGSGINYNPPTQAQKQTATDFKKKSTEQNNTSTNTDTGNGKTAVTPVITSWQQTGTAVAVRGFVSGVVEDGGKCTVALKSGGFAVTGSRTAVANATNTSCGEVAIPLSSLHSGGWQATLSYTSSTATGSSSTQTIEVK